jgi:coenzyme F420-reducing hydrogenase delta subunit
MSEFEPVILAFCCQYCAYNAADLAGSLRLQYPPNVRIIRTPCSGTIDPVMMLKAIDSGADGVIVAGCMEGDCHFMEGNYRAKARVTHAKTLLAEIGLEPERLEMFNMSAAMGRKFADTITEFTERIRQLGPSPVRAPKPADEETTEVRS